MYIIYHPTRHIFERNGVRIYHDSFGEKNEDPYLWNKQFLHSYCHITQMKSDVGNINFWVSGDTFPNFNSLYCDCVFVVEEKVYWRDSNNIELFDEIVDNSEAYNYHYRWGNHQHFFKRRKRYTLKASADKSFQPQNMDGSLVDIVPFLKEYGLELKDLRKQMKAGYQAKPMKLDVNVAQLLYEFLFYNAAHKIYGYQIANLHPK